MLPPSRVGELEIVNDVGITQNGEWIGSVTRLKHFRGRGDELHITIFSNAAKTSENAKAIWNYARAMPGVVVLEVRFDNIVDPVSDFFRTDPLNNADFKGIGDLSGLADIEQARGQVIIRSYPFGVR